MRLAQVFSIFSSLRLGDNPTQEVSQIHFDSRKVDKNSVFVAIRGQKSDAHDYLEQVCAAGAIGLVVEDASKVPLNFLGAVAVVKDSRQALNQMASLFFGSPSAKLFVVGITGTNGKTTTSNMVEKVLNEYGWPTGVIGTIDHHFLDKSWPSELTTPDPIAFQRRLAEFVALGAQAVCLEVSSHALIQSRVDEVQFDVGVFTNLTRDHLDYHGNMQNYFQAKQRLFSELLPKSNKLAKYAVINADDEYGLRLLEESAVQNISFGKTNAQLSFKILDIDYAGTRFEIHSNFGDAIIELKMTGLHNVYNACAAIAVGLAAGATLDTCARGISKIVSVNGRLDSVPNSKGLHVFVDYAHTDDALKNSLSHLHQIRMQKNPSAKLICVFGCGGDRDRGKRPLMLKAAQEFSDLVVVTSDNPRTELPMNIINEILGMQKESSKLAIEVDRRLAIQYALDQAKAGDVILIAGKGHEDYQIIGTERHAFSDIKVVKEYFA
jgi:UDP-N-acetylmuramoyl-L-alanyl-D-glutamate--2,6-diaminopimelate ligase